MAGLIILPLAMVAQLGDRITSGQMLQFLAMGAGIFLVGYMLQQFGGRR